MELFGIALSLPGAFTASLGYCWLMVHWLYPQFPGTLRWLRLCSVCVLAVLGLEVGFLLAKGPIGTRALIGPAFWFAHRLCFYLGVPALANVLVLRNRMSFLSRWYVAAFPCALLGFSLVLMEFYVSEALYGVDGRGGPFGFPPPI